MDCTASDMAGDRNWLLGTSSLWIHTSLVSMNSTTTSKEGATCMWACGWPLAEKVSLLGCNICNHTVLGKTASH